MATFSNRLNVYGLLPPPSLTIQLSGGNAILSWPTNAFLNFALQSNTDLLAAAWQNVTNTVLTTNGAFQVRIPASAASTFFRLKR